MVKGTGCVMMPEPCAGQARLSLILFQRMQKAIGSSPAAAEALVLLAAEAPWAVQDDVLTHIVYTSLLMHPDLYNQYEVCFQWSSGCHNDS